MEYRLEDQGTKCDKGLMGWKVFQEKKAKIEEKNKKERQSEKSRKERKKCKRL